MEVYTERGQDICLSPSFSQVRAVSIVIYFRTFTIFVLVHFTYFFGLPFALLFFAFLTTAASFPPILLLPPTQVA